MASIEFDRWDIEAWAAMSRRKEKCGIFGCEGIPVILCPHCGNWYCYEHRLIPPLPGHKGREKVK
jgi:hypothetical protein